MTHQDLPALLRDTAENIHSRGPSVASAHLRSAADRIEHLQSMLDAAKMREQTKDAVVVAMRICHCHPGRPMAGCPNPDCQR